ncbi:MAG: adenylate/guanylate cyclase domain-containing protein [Hyphomicrobiaceae bacterium]
MDSGHYQHFLNWINRAPEGADTALRRGYALARVGFPIGLLSHGAFIFLFWYLDQPVMALFNVFSVVLISWGVWSAWTLRDIKLPTMLTLLGEIPLHAVLATLYMGPAPFFLAFLLFPICLMPLLPYFGAQARLAQSMACVFVFVVAGTVAIGMEPLRPLSPSWNVFFFVFNAIPTIAFVGLNSAISDSITAKAEADLATEFNRAEGLLLNILPVPIAERLKDNPELIADEHPHVSVLFADIVNFTETSDKMAPTALVQTLNSAFSRFDALVEKHGCEKIKTIGDAYMVVSGLPEPRADHAQAMVSLALDMIDTAEEINLSSEFPFTLRIGVNSGPVVAGVIGEKKFAYDLWGDTVNVASRMESHGQPGMIQITEATRAQLSGSFRTEPLGQIDVKGKGQMLTYAVAEETPAA